MIFLILLLYVVGSLQSAKILGKRRCYEPKTQQIEESRKLETINANKLFEYNTDIKAYNIETPEILIYDEYYRNRYAEIESLRKGPKENYPYPSDVYVSKSLEEFDTNYTGNTRETIAGRVYDIGKTIANETVYLLRSESGDLIIQVILNARNCKTYEKNLRDVNSIKRGDIIAVFGCAGKKKSRDLNFYAEDIKLLAPCLHQIPSQLEEKDRFSKRYLDFIINEKSKNVFHKRAKIISTIRRFLENQGYLEVETPIFNKVPGGAKAKSFKTHYDYENNDWQLRISPELYHKMLIVGGFNKIYEIGRQFRNEKADMTHNPEFTTLEFYTTYANYTYLFDITESLLSDLVFKVHGSYKVDYKGTELDFLGPYTRMPMISTLEQRLNVTFPPAENLNSIEANRFLHELCMKHELKISAAKTSANLLDSLVGNFILSDIVQPTFVTDYPAIISPLAKSHPDSPGLTERFELFALGKELANAYVELNDPYIQRERFAQQDTDRLAGDDEIPPADEEYITALEYGLTPTAGFGMGIDRIVMFLTNASSIKDVILFPNTKI